MTEHERIDQIEQSLAGLEKQLYSLKAELRDLKQATTTESVTATDTVPVKPVAAAFILPEEAFVPMAAHRLDVSLCSGFIHRQE